jgi:hypothetical protein
VGSLAAFRGRAAARSQERVRESFAGFLLDELCVVRLEVLAGGSGSGTPTSLGAADVPGG